MKGDLIKKGLLIPLGEPGNAQQRLDRFGLRLLPMGLFGAFLGGAIQRAAIPYIRTERPDTVSTNGGIIYECHRARNGPCSRCTCEADCREGRSADDTIGT